MKPQEDSSKDFIRDEKRSFKSITAQKSMKFSS